MIYLVQQTTRFKKSYKLAEKRGLNMSKLDAIIGMLVLGQELPAKNRDHALVGNKLGMRECHIEPDWLLLYRKIEAQLILELVDTGTHSDLFKK